MKPRYVWLKRPRAGLSRQIVKLYRAAGWWEPGYTAGRISRIVKGSHCFLAALLDGRAVAMGRAISDRTSDAYIQDVFVLPAYQGRGIGAAMVKRLARRLRAGGMRWVGLIAADGSWPFYARLGFKKMARHDPMRLDA